MSMVRWLASCGSFSQSIPDVLIGIVQGLCSSGAQSMPMVLVFMVLLSLVTHRVCATF